MLPKRFLTYLFLFLWLWSFAVAAEESLPPEQTEKLSFTPLWIDDNETGGISEADLKATLDQLDPQSPDDIVILIHGFRTSREASLAQYSVIAPLVKEQFSKYQSNAAVVGVQWDSDAAGFLLTLPWAYKNRAERAERVGRMGVRQLLFALKERFPAARLTLLGHSMGCEVSGAALRPDWGNEAQVGQVFKLEEPLAPHGVVLLASDLDYDAAYRGGVSATHKPPELLWLTLSRITISRFERDRVLELRSIIRGKASGAAFPRMTEQQYDNLMNGRVVVFDNNDIPRNHSFLRYADQARLAQIVQALAYKAGIAAEPEVFQDIDKVLSGPGGLANLTPWFETKDLSPHVYALWRLEHEQCGSSAHMSDETLSRVARLIRSRPGHIRRLQTGSKCVNLHERIWPSPLMLEQFGAPDWSPLGGNTWIRYFRGEVTQLSHRDLTLRTDFFEQEMSFDLDVERARFTPSFGALRVGSKVEIAVDGPDVEWVRILTIPDWLSKQKRI